MNVNSLAGTLPPHTSLIDVPRLIAAYYNQTPDPAQVDQRVTFGTSGHRGSSFSNSFNESHILAIAQAICLYRKQNGIDGPLFLGIDTHPLSIPAMNTVVEVLAANGVQLYLSENDEFTPTPAISHAILAFNRGRKEALADGIVITPSHNPPHEGGIKYNPPHGGPADVATTQWIENQSNEFLECQLKGILRIPYEKALKANSTKRFDFLNAYVNDLSNVIDMDAIAKSGVSAAVDPFGGAGVHYWRVIRDRYRLNLRIISEEVDPTFRFMRLDWDGQIRMDPSSPYVMRGLIEERGRDDIAFACDTDHDRHGIVTKSSGLLPTNHFLSVAVDYLFSHRPQWSSKGSVGKTVVSSEMINRVAAGMGRSAFEVPVGFKWFVDGLMDGSLALVGEESAGATFLRKDGKVWTTDKDGLIPCLLAVEMMAVTGKDPGILFQELTSKYGTPYFERIDTTATAKEKTIIKRLSNDQIHCSTLAGEAITSIISHAPGNGVSIGGIKVSTENGWFAARPSGTENINKIYAESFLGPDHLAKILEEAQAIIFQALQEGMVEHERSAKL